MIVDTSALVAIIRREDHFRLMLDALLSESAVLPTPALFEFARVTAKASNRPDRAATLLVERLTADTLTIEPFTPSDAHYAALMNQDHGSGNGRGGSLNMLDLMVYAVAKRLHRPLLCTGRDFAATDLSIHPASRRH